jgi:hypothetical protein
LTTKDQGVIHERTMKTSPTPRHPQRERQHARPDPGSYSWKLLLIKDARVHYVVLKQQPRTTHPTHFTCVLGAARKPETNVPTPQPRTPPEGRTRGRAMVLLPQDPTVCQTLPGGSFRRAFQDTLKRGSVLAAGLCRQAPIC